LLHRGDGKKQCPGPANYGAEFVAPIKGHRLVVLGIHQHGERRRRALRDTLDRVHQDRSTQAAALVRPMHCQPADTNRRHSGITRQVFGVLRRRSTSGMLAADSVY
jgi:hypothetical protein